MVLARGAFGVDVHEDDGLAPVGERLGGVLEGVLAVLVLVDAHGHQRVPKVRPRVPPAFKV